METIICGCGSSIKSLRIEKINGFDALHGTVEHQQKVMEFKLWNSASMAIDNGRSKLPLPKPTRPTEPTELGIKDA